MLNSHDRSSSGSKLVLELFRVDGCQVGPGLGNRRRRCGRLSYGSGFGGSRRSNRLGGFLDGFLGRRSGLLRGGSRLDFFLLDRRLRSSFFGCFNWGRNGGSRGRSDRGLSSSRSCRGSDRGRLSNRRRLTLGSRLGGFLGASLGGDFCFLRDRDGRLLQRDSRHGNGYGNGLRNLFSDRRNFIILIVNILLQKLENIVQDKVAIGLFRKEESLGEFLGRLSIVGEFTEDLDDNTAY